MNPFQATDTKQKKPTKKPDAPTEPATAKGKCCVLNERSPIHNSRVWRWLIESAMFTSVRTHFNPFQETKILNQKKMWRTPKEQAINKGK